MQPSAALRGVLLSALVALGPACEGAGPFSAQDASDPPGSAPEGPSAVGAAAGKVTGFVRSVEPSKGTLVLSGDVRLRLSASTSIDKGGDFTTLVEVLAAISAGTPVVCEAEGFVEAGVLVVQKIRFLKGGSCEACDSGDGDPDDPPDEEATESEMDGKVSSADPAGKSFRIVGGLKVRVLASTEVGSDGACGCKSLVDLDKALEAGLEIRAEIRGRIEGGVLIATRVRFEVVGGVKDDGGDDDDDDAPKTITGIVASVDLLARTCRTTDGKLIEIKSDSIIDLAGDLTSLADVALRLTLGIRVRVEAVGTPTAKGIIASKVKFLVG